MDNKHIKKIWF